jgi:hypothetical protein
LFYKRNNRSMREPLSKRKGWWELEGNLRFQLYKDQMVTLGANLPGFRCH